MQISDAGTENPRIYLRPILIPVVTGKIFAILLTLSWPLSGQFNGNN